MASGKKNYFRHSFNARHDEFVIELINRFKEKGYFMWFALIETCAEMVNDGHSQPLKINQSRLYRELRCNHGTLKAFLTYCEGRSKVHSTYLAPTFNLEIVNLPKYLGKYSENAPNKIKEKEIKEKETISPTPLELSRRLTPDEIIQAWNDLMGKDFGYCPGLGGNKHRANCLEAIEFLPTLEHWENLFSKCRESEFLTGKGKSGWTVTLPWLVDYDNALKVLSEGFDEQKALRKIIADGEAIVNARQGASA